MSTPRNDGGSAFPAPDEYSFGGRPLYGSKNLGGMSLRDYFAGQAMIAFLNRVSPGGAPDVFQFHAGAAYQMADAMLEARKEGKKP